MSLSNKNPLALLLDLNQDIEEYAETSVKNIIDDKIFDFLTYPPNGGLTELEIVELKKLDNNEHLKNALRKIITDNSAGVVFNLLNLLDGTGSPKHMYDEWTGVVLTDEEPDENEPEFQDTLHDGLFEAYWDWKKIKR